MASSEIKALKVTATGDTGLGRARVVGISAATLVAGTGNLILKDTSNSGTTKLDVDFGAATGTEYVELSQEGILFKDLVWVNAITNLTSVTIFYVG